MKVHLLSVTFLVVLFPPGNAGDNKEYWIGQRKLDGDLISNIPKGKYCSNITGAIYENGQCRCANETPIFHVTKTNSYGCFALNGATFTAVCPGCFDLGIGIMTSYDGGRYDFDITVKNNSEICAAEIILQFNGSAGSIGLLKGNVTLIKPLNETDQMKLKVYTPNKLKESSGFLMPILVVCNSKDTRSYFLKHTGKMVYPAIVNPEGGNTSPEITTTATTPSVVPTTKPTDETTMASTSVSTTKAQTNEEAGRSGNDKNGNGLVILVVIILVSVLFVGTFAAIIIVSCKRKRKKKRENTKTRSSSFDYESNSGQKKEGLKFVNKSYCSIEECGSKNRDTIDGPKESDSDTDKDIPSSQQNGIYSEILHVKMDESCSDKSNASNITRSSDHQKSIEPLYYEPGQRLRTVSEAHRCRSNPSFSAKRDSPNVGSSYQLDENEEKGYMEMNLDLQNAVKMAMEEEKSTHDIDPAILSQYAKVDRTKRKQQESSDEISILVEHPYAKVSKQRPNKNTPFVLPDSSSRNSKPQRYNDPAHAHSHTSRSNVYDGDDDDDSVDFSSDEYSTIKRSPKMASNLNSPQVATVNKNNANNDILYFKEFPDADSHDNFGLVIEENAENTNKSKTIEVQINGRVYTESKTAI